MANNNNPPDAFLQFAQTTGSFSIPDQTPENVARLVQKKYSLGNLLSSFIGNTSFIKVEIKQDIKQEIKQFFMTTNNSVQIQGDNSGAVTGAGGHATVNNNNNISESLTPEQIEMVKSTIQQLRLKLAASDLSPEEQKGHNISLDLIEHQSTQPKPNRRLVGVTVEGLMSAAGNILNATAAGATIISAFH